MLGGPHGQSKSEDGNEPLCVSLIWSKGGKRKPVALCTIFISIRNGKRRLCKCHLFPPCLLTPSLTHRKWCSSYFWFTCNWYTLRHFSRSPFLIDPPSIATSRTHHRPLLLAEPTTAHYYQQNPPPSTVTSRTHHRPLHQQNLPPSRYSAGCQTSGLQFFAIFFSASRKMLRQKHKLDL
jgi:hypothetical protein